MRARRKLREARDRLAVHEYRVGYLLLPLSGGIRARSIGSSRFSKNDPEFTRRDAVYFYLGEC